MPYKSKVSGGKTAISVVIAELENAATADGEAATDRAIGVVENQRAVDDGDAAGEIVAAGFAKRKRRGSVFDQGRDATDLARAAQTIGVREIREPSRAGSKVHG